MYYTHVHTKIILKITILEILFYTVLFRISVLKFLYQFIRYSLERQNEGLPSVEPLTPEQLSSTLRYYSILLLILCKKS